MVALVVTHAEVEGPGWIEPWLVEAGLEVSLLEPWRGDPLPTSLDGVQALVVMGGPQDAWDDTSAPWLAETKALLRTAVAQGVPTLGVCLGAQLLALAAGGRVEPGDKGPELGARFVARRDAAGADPLFWDLPLSPVVVQWHWDAVTALPPGATLLMAGTAYENQAFRVGERAWGIQFHVETPPEMVTAWVGSSRAHLEEAGVDVDALLGRTLSELDEVAEVWGEVVRRFARLALER